MCGVYIISAFHDGDSAISEPPHLSYVPSSRLNYPGRATHGTENCVRAIRLVWWSLFMRVYAFTRTYSLKVPVQPQLDNITPHPPHIAFSRIISLVPLSIIAIFSLFNRLNLINGVCVDFEAYQYLLSCVCWRSLSAIRNVPPWRMTTRCYALYTTGWYLKSSELNVGHETSVHFLATCLALRLSGRECTQTTMRRGREYGWKYSSRWAIFVCPR